MANTIRPERWLKLCPKCGSEMVEWDYSKRRGMTPRETALCSNSKCGHEEKVGGKP